MKFKQLVAIVGLSVAGVLIAYGLSLLTPPVPLIPEGQPFEELDATTRAEVEKEFSLPPGNAVYVDRHEGDFYMLSIFPFSTTEGGFWAIVKKTGSDLFVIDSGNKYEYEVLCSLLEEHGVPNSVAPQCDNGNAFIDRSDGHILERATMSE